MTTFNKRTWWWWRW